MANRQVGQNAQARRRRLDRSRVVHVVVQNVAGYDSMLPSAPATLTHAMNLESGLETEILHRSVHDQSEVLAVMNRDEITPCCPRWLSW